MSNATRRTISRNTLGNILVMLLLAVVAAILFFWQRGPLWNGPPPNSHWGWAGLSLALYAGFTAWTLWRTRITRQAPTTDITPDTVLVAHASQTGFAMQLAQRTIQSLQEAKMPTHLVGLDALDAKTLMRYGRALFVVSTTGEGDPPDPALGFVQDVLSHPAALIGLQYAVLALGDSTYTQFCAFGRQLDEWLHTHGAIPLFDRVEVDNADEAALRHWQHHLSLFTGNIDLRDWSTPNYETWTLAERQHLNAGSVGLPVYHLALTPPGTMPNWQAGDLVEVGPQHPSCVVSQWLQTHGFDATAQVQINGKTQPLAKALASRQLPEALTQTLTAQALIDELSPLPHREYSIASMPADSALHLLLRRMQRPDGSPGLTSGWLCDHAPLGASIELRLRSNPNFHPPQPEVPMILIGNGTGIAGLRALLKARISEGAKHNWLLFGERQRAHDFYYKDELSSWQKDSWITRLDVAFSRDSDGHHYVQDALYAAAPVLQKWIENGAAVYLCGSLDGMAQGVDTVLRQVLSDATVDALRLQGRYRRDVY